MVVPNKHLYTENGVADARTAKSSRILRSIALDIKQNIRVLKQAGIPLEDSMAKTIGKLPNCMIALIFRIMIGLPLTRDVLIGDHALTAKPEVMQLDEEFNKLRKMQTSL